MVGGDCANMYNRCDFLGARSKLRRLMAQERKHLVLASYDNPLPLDATNNV